MHKLLNIGLIAGVFLLLIAGYLHPITAFTQDLGRHILTGKIIATTLSVPKTNLFSYTASNFPFINHHWLTEVFFYFQYQLLGSIGLQIISIGVIIAAFGAIFFYAQKRAALPAIIIVSLFYLRVLFERTDIRPELYSFLFLSIFITTLYTFRERFTKLIYSLIPLELLWVNMHIYFFVGIITIALFLLDELFIQRKNLKNKHTATLLVVFVMACFMTLLNPNGPFGALYPLHVFKNYGYAIEENQTIFLLEQLGLNKPSILFFKLSALLLFTSLFISYKKTKPIDWLLALVFTFAGAMAVRNFPLFVFATFIPACISLTHAFDSTFIKKRMRKQFTPYFLFLLILLVVWQIAAATHTQPLGFGIARGAERGVDFYLTNNLSGPIFNNFDIGSYIEYRMYPKERVFIDGRPEAYPASFIQDIYIPMQQDPKLFEVASKKYKFNSIFFSHTDMTPWANAFLGTTLKSPSWKPVYLDDTIIIFLKNTEHNQHIIKKYGMNEKSLKASSVDQNDANSLLRLASFYNKSGLSNQELTTYQRLLQLQPNNCVILYNTAILLSNRGDPTANLFAARYQNSCGR